MKTEFSNCLILITCIYSMITNSCTKDYTTVDYGNLMDQDGNTYKTIKIGQQEWMVENLKTTKYKDGTPIPNLSFSEELTTGAYCWYNNDLNNKNSYGALYNYYAVANSHGLCPDGWHVPTKDDWETLITYLGGKSVAGYELKERGSEHWICCNSDATNSSKFEALPGGYSDQYGFYFLGDNGYWWSSTEFNSSASWSCCLISSASFIWENGEVVMTSGLKGHGLSIRCVRD